MEFLEKMLKEETDSLLNQVVLIKDKVRRDEIIKSFLVDVNRIKDSINQELNKEKNSNIDEFIKIDDDIRKLPSRKRNFTKSEREVLSKYLDSIKEVNENTEEENRKLYELMKSNNIIERTKAREDLIKGNMKLALRFLSRVMLSYNEVTNLDDMIDEVNLDLIRTVNFYNPEMGPLKSLLYFTIKRSIGQCIEVGSRSPEVPSNIRKLANEIISDDLSDEEIIAKNNIDYTAYNNLRNVLLSKNLDDEIEYLDEEMDDYMIDPNLVNPSFEDLVLADKEGLKNCIKDMLKTLEPREEKVLTLRFGLFGNDHMTLKEIAKLYNLTKERVRVIEARALRKLRHPMISREIRRSM